MILVFLVTSLIVLQVQPQCISLDHSKCGPLFSNLQVSTSLFPNVSSFDSTIDRFVRGSDSVSLLTGYVGCKWDPRVHSRYPSTFFCHLIARQENSAQNCPALKPVTLCESTCTKWIQSLSAIFKNNLICSGTAEKQVANRQLLLEKFQEFCSSNFVSNDPHCSKYTRAEASYCGFGTLNAAVRFCRKAQKELCCQDTIIQQRLPSLHSSKNNASISNESTQDSPSEENSEKESEETTPNDDKNVKTCSFSDWNCSIPLKVTLIVCVICIPAIIALLFWKKKLEEKAQSEYSVSIPTKDDDLAKDYSQYLEPKTRVEHAYISNSRDKKRHLKTYSSQSVNLENGFTIYQAMFDHKATLEREIDLRKGDQVVLKDMGSDSYALGVNLNSGLEGLVLLTVLKTYYHTDDSEE